MLADLDSSSIIFPPASSESKLAALPTTKMPDYADWTVYNFYNRSMEKSLLPPHMLSDVYHLAPTEWNKPMGTPVAPEKHVSVPHSASPGSPLLAGPRKDLRHILQGALDAVEKNMEETMHDYNTDYNWSWSDNMPDMTWDSDSDSDQTEHMPMLCDLSSVTTAAESDGEASSTTTVNVTPAESFTFDKPTKPLQMAVYKLKKAAAFTHKTKRISTTNLVRYFQKFWDRKAKA